MAQQQTPRARAWCFTVNNPGGWTPPVETRNGEPQYMIWQYERAPNTGTRHIQGYVCFNKQIRMKQAKEWLNTATAHLEVARGNQRQNRDYCSKEESRWPGDNQGPFEIGNYDEKQGKGKRTDLTDVAEKITAGASRKQIAQEHPETFIKYNQGIQALIQELKPTPPMERNITVTVLWGTTGTGKTHRARTQFPDIYSVEKGRDPWGSYRGQTEILFDEFRWEDWLLTEMNKYLDKWRLELNCRYFNKYAEWTRVIICSNEDPRYWYPTETQMCRDALFRRLHEIHEVKTIEQNIIF